MSEKPALPLNLTPEISTMGGTSEGSVYTKIAETADATLALKIEIFMCGQAKSPVMCVGGRLRAQLKTGEFPVVPEDNVRGAFGYPELQRRSSKHLSVQFGMPITSARTMSFYIRKLIDDGKLLDKMVTDLLGRLPKKTKRLITNDKLKELFLLALDDTVPNVLPGDIDHTIQFEEGLTKLKFDVKTKPV